MFWAPPDFAVPAPPRSPTPPPTPIPLRTPTPPPLPTPELPPDPCAGLSEDEIVALGLAPYDASSWRLRLQNLRGEEDEDIPLGTKLHLNSINEILESLTFKVNIPPITADVHRAGAMAERLMNLRSKARTIVAENGEEVIALDVQHEVLDLINEIRKDVNMNAAATYEKKNEWEPLPDTEELYVESSSRMSVNPVSNLLFASKVLNGKPNNATTVLDRLLRLSVMRVNHLPETKYYCHEEADGNRVSRDEVYRLQQMSRRLPFDDVMSHVALQHTGKLYWVAESTYGDQCVRTEHRNRTEPSYATNLGIHLPRYHTKASKVSVALSLWDEAGPVGRDGFHHPVKVGSIMLDYLQSLQILRSPKSHMPDILKMKHFDEEKDGIDRNAAWLPLQGSYKMLSPDNKKCWVLVLLELPSLAFNDALLAFHNDSATIAVLPQTSAVTAKLQPTPMPSARPP